MKNILYILIIFAYACQSTTAQKIDESIKEDQDFEILMNKVAGNTALSLQVQVGAAKEQKKIVGQAVNQIVSLKQEVSELKSELNNVKSKLDSNLSDTGVKYKLFPISNR